MVRCSCSYGYEDKMDYQKDFSGPIRDKDGNIIHPGFHRKNGRAPLGCYREPVDLSQYNGDSYFNRATAEALKAKGAK